MFGREPPLDRPKSHLGVVIADLTESNTVSSENGPGLTDDVAAVVDVSTVVDVDLVEEDDVLQNESVIRLAEEDITVSKRSGDVGGVQVSRVTRTYRKPIEEILRQEKVEVERVALDQPVDDVPPVRQEGDVIIVPVVEEIISVERRLVLKEEVRIRKVETTEKYQDEVTLHKQEAVVTRLDAEGSFAADRPDSI